MQPQAPPRTFAGTMLIWASIVIVVAGLRASASLVVAFLLALFLAILCGPPPWKAMKTPAGWPS